MTHAEEPRTTIPFRLREHQAQWIRSVSLETGVPMRRLTELAVELLRRRLGDNPSREDIEKLAEELGGGQ